MPLMLKGPPGDPVSLNLDNFLIYCKIIETMVVVFYQENLKLITFFLNSNNFECYSRNLELMASFK